MAERITQDDLERHGVMVGMIKEALALARDPSPAATYRRIELIKSWNAWTRELYERYRIAADGTAAIDEQGYIIDVQAFREQEAAERQSHAERVELELPRPLSDEPFVLSVHWEAHHAEEVK